MNSKAEYSPALLEWGIARATLTGQDVSGDLHLVEPFLNSVLVAVVDGLGHGPEAAWASETAIAILKSNAGDPITSLVKRCHENLKKTRGVVMTLASINGLDGTLTWLGIGNAEGVLIQANPEAKPQRESLLLRSGVVGYRLPTLRASVLPIMKHDLLVFCTDGIKSGFNEGLNLDDSSQQIADQIVSRFGKGTDDALALVARYLGIEP